MAVIAVTRLRLRDQALFDAFFAAAVAVGEQVSSVKGCLGESVFADRTPRQIMPESGGLRPD